MRGYTPVPIEGIHNTGLMTQKENVEHSMRKYWPVKSEITMNDDIAMKGKTIKIPF